MASSKIDTTSNHEYFVIFFCTHSVSFFVSLFLSALTVSSAKYYLQEESETQRFSRLSIKDAHTNGQCFCVTQSVREAEEEGERERLKRERERDKSNRER